MNSDLVSYYKDRAKEYEKLYSKPERQEDLKNSATILQEIFADKQVIEIACGTGYWTEKIAATATSIFATDINESVIDIAKKKDFSSKQV
jgi:ubiquinone/menaquinone biosynthesis C-methylase UbiE